MANATTMTVTLKAVSDFSDVKTNVGQLKNAFSQLKLPSDLKGQFSNIFSGLEKDVSKASEMMAKGFKTTGDVSKFETVVDKISKGFRDLQAAASEVSPDMVLDSFTNTPELENAISKLKELTKAWEDLRTSGSNDATKKIEDALKSLGNVSKNKSIGEFQKAFDSLDFSKMEEAFAKLKEGENYFADGSKNGQIYKDTMEELGKAFEQIKVTPELKDLGRQLQEAGGDVNKLSEEGRNNLLRMIEQLIGKLPQASDEVDKLGKNSKGAAEDSQELSSSLQSFANKAKYFLGLENAVRLFKRAVREAFETVKELDAVMTETAVVTEFDVGDMWEQLPEYTARAKELGVGLKDAYESATIFYQQGLDTAQVNQLSTETLKMARIAGLDAAEATDRMTNALRGFNMELNQANAQRVSDVYSKLAAITASDTDEISTAMTKVASLANSANMSFESTAAFLSQIIETTRESAETAGTALKTVVARFSEVKKLYSEGELTGVDAEGEAIDVNRVSAALRTAGIDLNEFITGAKGLDDIFMELASKWDSLTLVQQRYIATMAAGSRQQSRFIALMSDYDRTLELVEAANNANGAANEQYGKTAESLQFKLNNLKTSWETFLMGIANNEAIKKAIDLLTKLLDIINKITSGSGAWQSFSKIGISLAAFDLGKIGLNKIIGKVIENSGSELSKSLKGIFGDSLGKGFGEVFKGRISKITTFLQKHGKEAAKIAQNVSGEMVEAATEATGEIVESAGEATGEIVESAGEATGSLKGLWTALKGFAGAHPALGIGALVIGAAVAGLAIYEYNLKKVVQAYDDLEDEISETDGKISDAKAQLEETTIKIDEYKEKKVEAGMLTIVEQTELDSLEQERVELQKNIDTLTAYNDALKASESDTAWKALKASSNRIGAWFSNDPTIKDFAERAKISRMSTEDIWKAINSSWEGDIVNEDFDAEIASAVEQAGYMLGGYSDDKTRKNKLEEWRKSEIQKLSKWIEDNRDKLDDLVYGYDDDMNELIEAYHLYDATILNQNGYTESAFSTLINGDEFEKVRNYLKGLVEEYGGTADNIDRMTQQLTKDLGDDGKGLNSINFDKFIKALEAVGLTIEDQDYSSLILQFAKVTNSIEDLNNSANSLTRYNQAIKGMESETKNWKDSFSNLTSGTEGFTSYAETYKDLMDRIEKAGTLDFDDNIVAAEVERLIGAEKIFDLEGDKDKILDYLKGSVATAFKDAESMGSGLLTILSQVEAESDNWDGWTENAVTGALELKNAENEVIATIDKANNHWDISSEHLEEVAESLGLTKNELVALMSAYDAQGGDITKISTKDLEKNIFESDLGTMTTNGEKKVVTEMELRAKWTEEGINNIKQAQLLADLKNDKDGNIIVFNTKLTGDGAEDLRLLQEEGIIGKEDGKSIIDIAGIMQLLQQSGIEFGTALKEINDKFVVGTEYEKDYKKTLNELVKTYSNGTIDLNNFSHGLEGVKNILGEDVTSIRFQDLEDSLRAAHFSEADIKTIIDKFSKDAGVLRISTALDWSKSSDEEKGEIQEKLIKMGIFGIENGKPVFSVEALVQTTIDQGGTKADAINTAEQIQAAFDGIEYNQEDLNEAWENAISSAKDAYKKQADSLANMADNADKVDKSTSNIYSNLSKAAVYANNIASAAERAQTAYNNTVVPSGGSTGGNGGKGGKGRNGNNAPPGAGEAASGKNIDEYSGPTLVGELGPEIRAANGETEIVGANGPEIINVNKNDVILPADTTEEVLKKTGGKLPDKTASHKGGKTPKREQILLNTGGGGEKTRLTTIKANNKTKNTTTTDISGNLSSPTKSTPTSSGNTGNSGGGSSASSATSKSKEAWDKFYKDLKHQREMDEINDAQYYAALAANYQNYLDTSEENLDTWNSVVEEIYKGNYSTLTKAWNDELSEWDHKIAMEQATEADKLEWMKNNNEKYLSDNTQQHKDYQKALEDIHKGEIDAQKNAFNEGKEALEHALAMDLIKEEEYYKKVDELAQKTLVGNQKEIIKERQKNDEDMHKHEIKTQQDAWSKRQSDLEYELEMGKITQERYWKEYAASYKEILVSNAKEVADKRLEIEREVQKGIRALRKEEFDKTINDWDRLYNAGNTKTDAYVQGLSRVIGGWYQAWHELDKDGKEERIQTLFDLSESYENMASDNASALEKMHDLVVKQIQSEKKAEMEAIDVKIKDLKTVADARKQAIDDIEKENDYLKEQRGLQKTAAQLEAELEMMKSDTSAAGMAKRRKLEAQLAEQKEKIADSEHKHSIEAQKDQIDKQTQMQTEALEAQKKAIEDYTNNEIKVSEDAWIKMNVAAKNESSMSKFFENLSNWAKEAGLDIQDEISTTVAGFEDAMKQTQINTLNAMMAYEEAGLGPLDMLQSLMDASIDVSSIMKDMETLGLGDEWTDDVKGLLASGFSFKGINVNQIEEATQRSGKSTGPNIAMTEEEISDISGELFEVGVGWKGVEDALNHYMKTQGKSIRFSANDWMSLSNQMVKNKISLTDLSNAMHGYSNNTKEWLAATGKVDDAVNGALIVQAKYGEVTAAINAMRSAYGAYEMDMLTSGQKVIPAVDSFTYQATQIVNNSVQTIDQKVQSLQQETEQRWNSSTFGQFTPEQQAAISENTEKLKAEYGFTDEQIQAGWDAVNYGILTPDEVQQAAETLARVGSEYNLQDDQIQAGWNAVTHGTLSGEQLAQAEASLGRLKKDYGLSDQTISLLWDQLTYGTLTVPQLLSAENSCRMLVDKYGVTVDAINAIWRRIAEKQMTASDFSTFSDKLDRLAGKTGTTKDTVNTIIGKIASGEIDGSKLPAITGIIDGLDKIYTDGKADADKVDKVLEGIATGKIDPKKLETVKGIIDVLDEIPKEAKDAKKVTNETLSAIGAGKSIDISNLKGQVKNMKEELAELTAGAIETDIATAAIGTGQAKITADSSPALIARAALRAAAKLDTYSSKEMAILDATGNGKVDAVDARKWLRRASQLESYASGTSSVPSSGTYRIDEGMKDELIYDPSQNALLSYLNRRSIVFPADVSRTMKQLFFNPDLLSPSISAPSAPSMEASINNTTCGDIRMGDIVINGNTDQKTIAQIRAEQKRQAKYIGDIFERDQRFMTNI